MTILKTSINQERKKEFFYVSSAIQNAIDIIKPSLDFSDIHIVFKIEEDKKIRAYENEYSQVILNFLTNAKDVLIERKISNPKIEVKLEVKNSKSILSVCDNAGGIKVDVLEKVFEPYVRAAIAFVACIEICGRFSCFGKVLRRFPSQISCHCSR